MGAIQNSVRFTSFSYPRFYFAWDFFACFNCCHDCFHPSEYTTGTGRTKRR